MSEKSLQIFPVKYGLVTRSHKLFKIFSLMDKIMDVNEPVLIQGESGTGKELVAKALHFSSKRKKRVFLAENCTAIANTLLESELFGHTKGAFTGADKSKQGLFELARGGTIFLDEIGDISQEMQKKLLRVLQEGEFRKVGGENIIKLKNTRIITATNKKLRDLVQAGKFRDDLFYRLNVININIPPLRERREDIPLLIKHFLSRIVGKEKTKKIEITDEAMKMMIKYDWPGNVRELKNEIKKAILLDNKIITLNNLSENIRWDARNEMILNSIPGSNLKEMRNNALRKLESNIILERLNKTRWNKSRVAKELGVSRECLRLKIMKYKLDRRR